LDHTVLASLSASVVPGVPGRAGESIIQGLGVVIVSTVTLAPGQTQRLLGLELLAIGAALWILLDLRGFANIERNVPGMVGLGDSCRGWTIGDACLLRCWSVAVGALWRRSPLACSGLVFSFIAGVQGAWALLVDIMR
jgi:hypothetical protein